MTKLISEGTIMLALLSPAKRLNFDDKLQDFIESKPVFNNDAKTLASVGSKLSKSEISTLMKLSPQLTNLTLERFKSFSMEDNDDNAKPAAFAFSGDTYVGLDARTIQKKHYCFFQENIRILSGLYGVLRPFDKIKPYRLEMGSKFKNPKGENLYDSSRCS